MARMSTRAREVDEWLAQVSSEPRAQHQSYGGLTPLLYATREGCLSCVQSLVEGGAKLNLPDPEGVTPLIMAITNAHFDTAKYLIEKGAMVDKWDWWGRSPLYCAVDMNTIPHGGRADGPSLDETTPLDIIALLLDKGANPNLQLKLLPPFRSVGADRGVDQMLTIGVTPLLRAAKALDAPAIKLLLAHGALVNLPEYSRHHAHHGRRRAWVRWMPTRAASSPLPMFRNDRSHRSSCFSQPAARSTPPIAAARRRCTARPSGAGTTWCSSWWIITRI